LAAFRRRACSTRIRRIASAAAAKKCPRLFQCCAFFRINEPEIGFMDQGRRLQRQAGILLCHLLRRQVPQFVIEEGQELFCSSRVSLLDVRQNPRDIAHDCVSL
jgi:hypothetical protein